MTHSTACLFSTLNRWILHDCQMRGCWICFGIFAFGFGQIESILFFYCQLWPKYNFQTRFNLFRCSMALSVEIWMLSLTKYATGVSLWENWQMCEQTFSHFQTMKSAALCYYSVGPIIVVCLWDIMFVSLINKTKVM